MSGTMGMPGMGIGGMGGLASGQNPMMAGAMSNMSQMPTEQLQELAARVGGSQQGMMAQRALQQRHMMPQPQQQQPMQPLPQGPGPGIGGTTGTAGGSNMARPGGQIAQTPQATAAGIALPPTTDAMNRGGIVPRQHFDIGGVPTSEQTPWYTKAEAHGSEAGLIHSYTPGRTDTINMEPLAGSYIVPADVISGLGEGNTLAGSSVMDRILSTGPGGIPMPRGEHGRGPPAPIRPPAPRFESAGGPQTGADGSRVPIIAAGGEYKVSPEQVRALGGGDLKRGHDLLDKFVLEIRSRTIKDLKKLPPPKKK